MKKIPYWIEGSSSLFRIISNTTEKPFCYFTDGACIGSLEVLMLELKSISEACKEHGAVATFQFYDVL